MCLGIPMQIESLEENGVAKCHADGVRREVSISLLGENSVEVGDFVMVHVGYAIQKVSPVFARSAWETTAKMQEAGETDQISEV